MISKEFDNEKIECGRQIGYDLYKFDRTINKEEFSTSIVEGFLAAQAQKIPKTNSDRFIRKWLQLRVNAFHRDHDFDHKITPDLLKLIDVNVCPVTRQYLTYGEKKSTDWSIDRINNDGAYALHNLAVISTQANLAKSNHTFEEVYAYALKSEITDGLTPIEWLRLASIMLGPCFIERSEEIPIIPLAAPIPLFTARFEVQIIQQLMTLTTRRLADKHVLFNRLKESAKDSQIQFKLGYLLESIHFELKGLEHPWDVWLSPKIMHAFNDWYHSMSLQECMDATTIAQSFAPVSQVDMNQIKSWKLGART